jgi:hypothetical protein
MNTRNALGIIVNSDRYFGFVTGLADAALNNEIPVRIHLLGPGWAYINTISYPRLSGLAQMSLCALSAQQYASQHVDNIENIISVVPPGDLSAVLQNCYRYVVF